MDDLRSRQDAARSGAQGAFNNNAFGGSLQDFWTQINADTNDSNSTRAAIANLTSKGASADFIAALSGSSNAGLASQFAGLSAAEVQRASQAYSIREYTSALQGQQAADQYQAQINAQAAQIAATQQLAMAVRNGAAAGTAGKARAAKTKAKTRRR